MSDIIRNPWESLRSLTQARIALGRVGASVPTDAQLAFQLAHAQARDAVHQALDAALLADRLAQAGMTTITVHSACPDRATYLQRPDLGRTLDAPSCALLHPGDWDLALVVADGLSALAIEANALPFLAQLHGALEQDGWRCAPVTIASQGRVAIGDEIGERVGARAVLVLIGERPGLSSPDSMGLYLTWAPRKGLSDASRNCISNVRPAGLGYAEAAAKCRYLLSQARLRALSGVALKDETDAPPAMLAGRPRNFLLE